MSQENVEMIRASLEAWNRCDWDEALKDAAPDFVLDERGGMERGPSWTR